MLQDVLPHRDKGRTEAEGGEITFHDYMGKVIDGTS